MGFLTQSVNRRNRWRTSGVILQEAHRMTAGRASCGTKRPLLFDVAALPAEHDHSQKNNRERTANDLNHIHMSFPFPFPQK
jgi:hypothetical protein